VTSEAARLAAAKLGYALAQEFKALRALMDKHGKRSRKVVIRTDTTGDEVKDYTVEIGPDGTSRISAEDADEHARAMEAWRAIEPKQLTETTGMFELRGAADAAASQPSFPSSHPPHAVLPRPASSPPELEERAQLFLAQFSQKQRAAANVFDTTHTLRLFVGIVGDRALAAVGTEDMHRWLDAIAHYPPNANKREAYKNLTPTEVVVLAKRTKAPAISLRTQEKHLDRLRVFFNWCVERRDIDRNPCASLHVMTREQEDSQSRRSFTNDELVTIFDPILRSKSCRTPAQWWLPALALYTGARAQELAQLHAQDVEQVADVSGIHFAARFPGQRLKNRQSKKFVPRHPALIQAGSLDYLTHLKSELGDGSLFSALGAKPGNAIGDWFNRSYLRKQ